MKLKTAQLVFVQGLVIQVLFATLLLTSTASSLAYGQALIVNHQSVAEFEQIPAEGIALAKSNLRFSYGHTSHGSQVIAGIGMVEAEYGETYDYTLWSSDCDPDVFICDRFPAGASDLGSPDYTTWATATRNMLATNSDERNVVMWSWCGQADTSEENIQTYLDLMSSLITDFPGVTFIYMTGHLVGTGEDGNLRARNDQIRAHVAATGGVLFDFAEIESFDPDGTFYPEESDGCGWCTTWCSTHECPTCETCAHSHCFNCFLKGKAFWWMATRLAGWGGVDGETMDELDADGGVGDSSLEGDGGDLQDVHLTSSESCSCS